MKNTKSEKENKFGDIVATGVTLEKANSVRAKIKEKTVGLWIYVVKRKNKKYDVGVQTGLGTQLSKSELSKVKGAVKLVKGLKTSSKN